MRAHCNQDIYFFESLLVYTVYKIRCVAHLVLFSDHYFFPIVFNSQSAMFSTTVLSYLTGCRASLAPSQPPSTVQHIQGACSFARLLARLLLSYTYCLSQLHCFQSLPGLCHIPAFPAEAGSLPVKQQCVLLC